jgi:hypothetical protein
MFWKAKTVGFQEKIHFWTSGFSFTFLGGFKVEYGVKIAVSDFSTLEFPSKNLYKNKKVIFESSKYFVLMAAQKFETFFF